MLSSVARLLQLSMASDKIVGRKGGQTLPLPHNSLEKGVVQHVGHSEEWSGGGGGGGFLPCIDTLPDSIICCQFRLAISTWL